jgi:lipoprotein-releasing system permease protein
VNETTPYWIAAWAAVVTAELAWAWFFRAWVWRIRASFTIAGLTSAAFLVLAGVVWVIFREAELDLDRDQAFFWVLAFVASASLGFGVAARLRRMPTFELAAAVIVTVEVAGLLALLAPGDEGIAGPSLRTLMVSPAALMLFAYFGASLGYLFFSSGRFDFKLGYEAIIGRRFLLDKGSSVLSVVTTISVFGVALGVWLVIIALGVLGGFEDDLQQKIIGAGAHGLLQQKGGWPIALTDEDLNALGDVAEVDAVSPFIEGDVALASQSNYTTGIVYGVDPRRAPRVLAMLRKIKRGSLEPLIDELAPIEMPEPDPDAEFLPPAPVPSVVIGREMASTLNVGVGDRVRIISPLLEQMTPLGMAPKTRDFRVVGIFSSQMYEFDARYVYVSLPAARKFFELEDGEVSGVHVAVLDPSRSDRAAAGAVAVLEEHRPGKRGWEALDWKARNQTLFAALKLERVVAFVVLAFIILVASFSIVSTLTMSVIEKQKEISIIKTMGARDVGVMKLFLVQGMLVGSFGTLIGAVMAVVTAALLKRIGFGIPGEVYYIDSLPVHVGAGDVVLIVLAALLIVWDFAVFPAIRGSRLEPVEGLRDG